MTKRIWLVLVFALTLATAVVQTARLSHRNTELQVANQNVAAALDTSRTVKLKNKTLDSAFSVQTRKLLQADIDVKSMTRARDSTQRALAAAQAQNHEKAKLLQSMQIQLASQDGTTVAKDSGVKMIPDSGRVADFAITGPPVDGTLHVIIPDDTLKPPFMSFHLSVRPIPTTVSVGCAEDGSINVTTVTPHWAKIHLEPGRAASEVCRPPDRQHWYEPSRKVSFLTGLLTGGYVVWRVVELAKH